VVLVLELDLGPEVGHIGVVGRNLVAAGSQVVVGDIPVAGDQVAEDNHHMEAVVGIEEPQDNLWLPLQDWALSQWVVAREPERWQSEVV
jgi:hypothetical protein